MSVEENKAIVRRFCEARSGLASTEIPSFVDEFIPPNYVSERRRIRSREEYKQRMIRHRNSSFLADAENTVEEMIAEGDKVVMRGTLSSTHTGTFFGIAPTGVIGHTDWSENGISRSNRVIRRWNQGERRAEAVTLIA